MHADFRPLGVDDRLRAFCECLREATTVCVGKIADQLDTTRFVKRPRRMINLVFDRPSIWHPRIPPKVIRKKPGSVIRTNVMVPGAVAMNLMRCSIYLPIIGCRHASPCRIQFNLMTHQSGCVVLMVQPARDPGHCRLGDKFSNEHNASPPLTVHFPTNVKS